MPVTMSPLDVSYFRSVGQPVVGPRGGEVKVHSRVWSFKDVTNRPAGRPNSANFPLDVRLPAPAAAIFRLIFPSGRRRARFSLPKNQLPARRISFSKGNEDIFHN
jgi:hypothetical protein